MASSTAQMKDEIARLTATINQHKSIASSDPGVYRTNSRSNTYVNPNYKPVKSYVRPGAYPQHPPSQTKPIPTKPLVKDVVINGIAFQSSARALVRKDIPKPVSVSRPPPPPAQSRPVTSKSGHLIPTTRVYKPKVSRGRAGRPMNRNMTLNNTIRPQNRRVTKKSKYLDKPCPRFTTTGTCSRGLVCPYQHDPSKIAICWNFLQGNCSNTAESCNLSHEPTAERTPLCLHFLNKGRCTRDNCPFPHVNVGAREGVCRDFAVLGYCEKGLDCEKQHVRECPDFAERGTCLTKGCKLPHVIRANRTRKSLLTFANPVAPQLTTASSVASGTDIVSSTEHQEALTVNDAQLGDEYISLTFNESESEDDDDDEGEDEEAEDDEDDEEDAEEDSDPNVNDNVRPG